MMAEVPKKEKFIRVGKNVVKSTVIGMIFNGLNRGGARIAPLHKAARDWLKRPRLAGHLVSIPVSLIGAVIAKNDLSDVLAYTAGYSIGDAIVVSTVLAEPKVLLYRDRIHVEGFDGNAEIKIVIDGKEYSASDFESPPAYGTLDTTNNKIITNASGVFEAKFKTPLEEGYHDVYVFEVGSKKAARLTAAI